METSARNLVITLALPHLSCEEDRVDFLAEQAILGALCLHGPVVARRAIRRTAKMLRDPNVIEALAALAAGLSVSHPPLVGLAEVLRRAAVDLQQDAEPADAAPPAPPRPSIRTPDEYDRRFTSVTNIHATPRVGGTLRVTQKHILFTSLPVTILPEKIVRKVVDGRPRFSGPIIRMLAVIPTQEGHDLALDAEIPAGFIPAQSLVLTPDNILALPEAVLNTEFVLADRHDLDLAFGREPETGYLTATVSATYRPTNAPGQQDVAPPSEVSMGHDADLAAPEAARAPEPPAPSAAAATDAPPSYSVVLTLNCCTPRDGLVRAIRDCVVDRGDGAGLPFDEAHAYAETLVQNFRQGEPVIVAKSASRESADIMCRAIIRTGARASVIPSVVSAGESAADNAAWHSLMLVDRGAPPHHALAHAIMKATIPTSIALRGGATEVDALRRAVDLIDNFTAPVEIARYESQATAERVRASLVEGVGERGARFAVVLSAPPAPRPVAPATTIPSPQPVRAEIPAPTAGVVPKIRAKKPRRSR